jgi:hypothetical protein
MYYAQGGLGHDSLSIILHFLQILLSVRYPTSRFLYSGRKRNIAAPFEPALDDAQASRARPDGH